jgi:hypothetical protein
MLRRLAALAVAGVCSAAIGAEVVESRFEVSFTRDGESRTYADTMVPYLPDSACYNWFVKFDPATAAELTLVETLSLPEPLAAWKDYVNDPASPTQVDADAQRAVTTLKVTPGANGEVSHGWCVAVGDPLGAHRLAVALDGTEIAGWDFTVVSAANYPFETPSEPAPPPPPQPSPTSRDVNQSW